MNKRAKVLDAMRNNPRDWRIDDLLVVAMQLALNAETAAVAITYSVFRA